MRKKILELELEGLPPTINHLYRNRGHMRYKTAEGQRYQEAVSAAISEQWGKKAAYTGAVEFWIKLITADRRRWDIDNRVKALQDCLSLGGAIKDDRQIEELHVKRDYAQYTATQIRLYAVE